MSQTFNNVWDALEPRQSANMTLRAELMMQISEFVKQSDLTQTEAAKRLNTTQPRLSDVMQGKIDKCSVDRLINMLDSAGFTVNLTVAKAA